jgi:hypothetical protein
MKKAIKSTRAVRAYLKDQGNATHHLTNLAADKLTLPAEHLLQSPSRHRRVTHQDLAVTEGAGACQLEVQLFVHAVKHRPSLA